VGILTPVTTVAARPGHGALSAPASAKQNVEDRILYLKSYLVMRAFIGLTGIIMPIALITFDSLLSHRFAVLGSLSVYYHTGVRDIFVGSLCAVSVFLITYKVFERNLDNTLSVVAGIAAMVIAFFPTSRPAGSSLPLTPFQAYAGEHRVAVVHYTAAAVFMLALVIISFTFGAREGKRLQQRGAVQAKFSPRFWRWFHWGCAIAILLSAAFIVVTQTLHVYDAYSLFIGETVAVFAFGVSWLAKGTEIFNLLGLREDLPSAQVQVAVEASEAS
jgi:hypothetical protein